MPTDRYTKTVLTVIAGALVALVVQNAISPAQAQLGGVPLYKGTVPVTIRSIDQCGRYDAKGNFIDLCKWEEINVRDVNARNLLGTIVSGRR